MLSEAHGISRTRVRRVLVRLQHENIVRFEHNRGAFICRPTVKEAHDLFDVRRFLEESVVRTLLRQRREGAPADPLFKAARDGAGDSPMQGLSDNFALRLAEATGNGVLVELLAGILRRCALLQAVYGATARKEPSESERIELVERIGKGDERGAIALLNQRLDRLVAELDLAKESGAPDIYARQ
jgi:DNA-binding GntR family transcriptional regulator